ncbi:hypothetical protein L1987_84723 [Smallanthus sonchifolius]|uniref:Uncharacterized protein n=1 Tax=Smallanthus sonchifolius TaxID=185202 RepID=A0ACB8XV62_9ASTR|nr:hypothetical protein L1987_84723 [Smallanthus sonchifolius]
MFYGQDSNFFMPGVWKLPTGTVEEGEDISAAAIREVREEAGIDTEFMEVLAFRQSHKSFFSKSDLMFVCMLKPTSLDIEKQDSEIEAAQWMAVEEYANQPFIKKHKSFDYIAKICVAKQICWIFSIAYNNCHVSQEELFVFQLSRSVIPCPYSTNPC